MLESTEDELTGADGMKNITNKSNKIFKKNETQEKFKALDNFETYCRPHHASINNFVIEFDKRFKKTKKLGTNITDDFLHIE